MFQCDILTWNHDLTAERKKQFNSQAKCTPSSNGALPVSVAIYNKIIIIIIIIIII